MDHRLFTRYHEVATPPADPSSAVSDAALMSLFRVDKEQSSIIRDLRHRAAVGVSINSEILPLFTYALCL